MLVSAEKVNKTFMGSKVLDNVDLTIEHGDRIAMMGPNGAGKTTLVRAMLGFYHIDSGKISVDGFDPVRNRVDVLKNISFIPQLPPPVKLSLEELLLYVERSSGVSRAKIFEESDRMDLDLKKTHFQTFLQALRRDETETADRDCTVEKKRSAYFR